MSKAAKISKIAILISGLIFDVVCQASWFSSSLPESKKYSIEDLKVKASESPLLAPSSELLSNEAHIHALARDCLIGKWSTDGCKMYARVWRTDGESIHSFITNQVINNAGTIEFKYDGTLTASIDGPGTWVYETGGQLFIHGKSKTKVDYTTACQVLWVSKNKMDWQLSLKYVKEKWKLDRACYDEHGWLHGVKTKANGNQALYTEILVPPSRYQRVSMMDSSLSRLNAHTWSVHSEQSECANKPPYRIIDLAREKGSDFAYAFTLELSGDVSIQTFFGVQTVFANEVRAAYQTEYPNADASSLRVVVQPRLSNGKIVGRAEVLTITPTSLSYDAGTRRGKLSVRFNPGQAEEARAWVRKNIETLAQDKNIALTTGQLPSAATYYSLGERIDGNVMEIEFKTE